MRILFIGNSFTARNDLPGLLASFARSRGKRLDHELIQRGGASLRMHWNSGRPQLALRGGKFDFVVLQEQSTLPIKNATRFHENVRMIDPAIRESAAKTVLYMTWARKAVPETQKQLTDAYVSIGKEIGAIVVPAGVAWERFLAKHDQPVLHDKDGSHPTFAGTYLAACVFFGTLFKEKSLGLEVPGDKLAPEQAKILQRAADEVCA